MYPKEGGIVIRAITLTQPWATLVAIGAKRIETRSWSTSHRGPLAIHAAKHWTTDERVMCRVQPFKDVLVQGGVKVIPDDLPLGAIVATARLVDCLPIYTGKLPRGVRCVKVDDQNIVRIWKASALSGEPMHVGDIQHNEWEAWFGSYATGRYAWILDDVLKLSEPIPARGALGLWNWDPAQ